YDLARRPMMVKLRESAREPQAVQLLDDGIAGEISSAVVAMGVEPSSAAAGRAMAISSTSNPRARMLWQGKGLNGMIAPRSSRDHQSGATPSAREYTRTP